MIKMTATEITAREKLLGENPVSWVPNTDGEWVTRLGPLQLVVLANQYQVNEVWYWEWRVNLGKSGSRRDRRAFPAVGWGVSCHDAQRLAELAARIKFMELREI
jgi:hypothetical protein